MSRVNLLPPEIRRLRRDIALRHRIRFFGGWLLVLLVAVFAVRSYEIYLVDGEVRDVEAQVAQAQESLAALADVAAARDASRQAAALTDQLLADEVLWSQQLLAIARIVPAGFTLTSFTGQVGAQATPGIVGTMVFSATSNQLVPTEVWLLRIGGQDGWANGWVSSVQVGEGGVFTASGSIDLTTAAIVPRGTS